MVIQTNKISLTLNGAESMKKLGVPVPDARDGRISKDILEPTMDCAVQRETGSSTVYTEAEARQLHREEVELPADSSFSPADFISQCMTGEDAKALSDEETPLEEYTSSQLERSISRVKEQRSEKRQAVEAQVAKEKEEREALEETAIQNIAGAGVSPQIQSQLQESNLPVTPETIARLTHAVDLAAERENLTQASMKFFIGSGLTITPENISGSVYGASRNKTAGNGDAVGQENALFENWESQVEEILREGGVEADAESIETAKWLYENELPVTAENVKICQSLEQLKELETDTLIARIADNMADGIMAEKADLTKVSVSEAEEAVRELLKTDEAILRRTCRTEADFISAKRQMEEIRLAMTIEAARNMSAKGIHLDVSNLEQIVAELREQEQQAKDALLMETGLPVTAVNAQVMSDTIQAAKDVLAAPVELLGVSKELDVKQSLTNLADSAVRLKAQYDKAAQTYEAVGTEVRRDLGDSLRKAFGSIDDILEDLNMEITGMNQRAVRILGYNQMSLTRENIEQMKAYDSKVTTLMKNLKPQVVAELIREEINPLEISLDELNEAVEEIRGEMINEDVSFRKFLWKMDHHGDLSDEERRSMIGVYRLLDKIEKSDGAVIGQVIKEGRELSLSSLLSATRTRKAEGLDVQIDDDFGGLEETISAGTSISDQIQSAYAASMVTGLQQNLSPKVLQEKAGESLEMSLEALLEACQAEGETESDMAEYYQQIAADVKKVMEDSDGQVQDFLKALQLPDTVGNLAMAQEYLSGSWKEYGNLWSREESEALRDVFDDPDALETFCAEMDEVHQEDLEKKKENDDITYDGIMSLAKMANGISFYRNLRSRQMYEVPIVTERGVTGCHVTIQHGDGMKGTVEISIESESLGKVQATFRVSARHVKGFVTVERSENLSECQQILTGFEKDLEENGFTMDSSSLIQGSRSSLHKVSESHTGDRSDGAKNQDLYQVAKWFIVNIAGKDDEA